jgi:hypothetical protein
VCDQQPHPCTSPSNNGASPNSQHQLHPGQVALNEGSIVPRYSSEKTRICLFTCAHHWCAAVDCSQEKAQISSPMEAWHPDLYRSAHSAPSRRESMPPREPPARPVVACTSYFDFSRPGLRSLISGMHPHQWPEEPRPLMDFEEILHMMSETI